MEPLYFKQFFELYEKQPNYLDTIQDELGIDPKSFEKSPEWAASVSLGNISYNGIMYRIKNFVYKNGEITGAMIAPMDVPGNKTQRAYINKGHQQIRSPDSSASGEEQFIPKEKLNSLLTQGMNAQGAGGGAAGGLPGAGGLPQ